MTERRPTFLIVGAQKSATRWLRVHLGSHPQVFTAPRELEFFNYNFHRGLAWYLGQFKGWREEPHAGEATPGYMMWREAPALQAGRIDGLLPGVRLFALLRNPVDRAYSAFIHHMARGRIAPDTDILDHVAQHPATEDPLGIVCGGWYAASLAPYADVFGDRLKVFLHEDIATRPAEVFESALTHLGLEVDHLPLELDDVLFSTKPPPTSSYTSSGYRRSLTPDERNVLASYFAHDVECLRCLGMVGASAWADDFPNADEPFDNTVPSSRASSQMKN